MPDSTIEWAMFLFFAIGGVGGWVTLACLLLDVWAMWRKT